MIDLFFKEVRESSKCPFIEENVERLLHDLFGAGTDTSANMLAWLLLIMTQYPDVQLKVGVVIGLEAWAEGGAGVTTSIRI